MMTSSGFRNDAPGSFASRRGHSSQLSISDPSHHVTEAIGTLYGDEEDNNHDTHHDDSRPLSFIADGFSEQIYRPAQHSQQASAARGKLTRSISDQATTGVPPPSENNSGLPGLRKSMTLHSHASNYRGQRGPQSPGHSPADPLSRRDGPSDPTSPRFPLTDIKNPSDIAQELSNLQALRRLSMDVGNNIDPDMPPMTLSAIPSLAPSGDDDENDPSRLLWVPARVHPELAPSEFKHFLENRVQSIRRRSGDSLLSPDGELSRSDSALKRRKSRLSQQIVSADVAGANFADSAARLGRERSEGRITPELSLEELVNDPTGAVQKLAHESQLQHTENTNPDDMPILPMAPGTGLRRSTRTTYRKGGSLRYGSGSKRTISRQLDDAAENTSKTSPEASPRQTLDRVQSEPVNENFSRPNRSIRRPQTFSQEAPDALAALEGKEPGRATSEPRQPIQDTLPLRTASSSSGPGIAFDADAQDEYAPNDEQEYGQSFPKRTTSQSHSNTPLDLRQEHTYEEQQNPVRDNRRSSNGPIYGSMPSQYMSKNQSTPQHQSLSEGLAASPTIPGGGNTRTDALTFIPTLSADDRKWEKKSKKEKDDDASSVSSKSSGWKWFKGSSDDKEKKKEKDENRRSKARAQAEKTQDSARLDVLQTSIEKSSSKARESLVMDRDSFDGKLQDERKKESRKSDVKKDKDSGLFSSLFGGSRKKDEKEKSSKKSQFLHVPEEPQPYKPLQADVDYNWTRFPLLEERAIYRMAHIKLANPRRPLLSQVLLSNFMYSYLAIVQAMHPQMNIPVSPQQKRLEEEARRKQEEDEYLAQQGMDGHDQAIDQYNFDYHRATMQYADSGPSDQVDYVDDAQIYEDDHGDNQSHTDYDYNDHNDYNKDDKDYYHYRDDGPDHQQDGHQQNMW